MRIIFRAVKYRYLQLLRIKDTPSRVALGFALGVAAGCLPCMGVQSLIALPLAFLVRANKISSLIGVWWTNPLTFVPIYYTEYVIGTLFSSYPLLNYKAFYSKVIDLKNLDDVANLGIDILMPMTLGSLVMAAILGPITFFVCRYALEKRRERRKKKRLRKAKLKQAKLA